MKKSMLAIAIALLAQQPVAAQGVAASDLSTKWKWVEEKNPMTDVVTYHIALTADTATGPVSAEKPRILIDCDTATKKPTLTIITNTGLVRSSRGATQVDFRVRLDQLPAQDASWPAGYGKFFASTAADYIIPRVAKSSRLLVEIPLRDGTHRVITFSTGGLAPHLERLEPICKR